MACACLGGPIALAAGDDGSRDPKFDELMAQTARTDPDSPAVLESLLEHVDALVKSREGGCEKSLEEAQAALDAASHRPAVSLLLPLGPARLADLGYELHRAKAACAASSSSADAELRLALEAAQQGVERHREALDYPAMAVMQFNAAATMHVLGEQDAAVSALAAALDMDHEYGLLKDAQENQRLMQQWRTGAQPPAAPAETPAPAAARSVSLKFGWRESDAQDKIEVSVAYLSEGNAAQVAATKVVTQHLRQVGGMWRLSRDLNADAATDVHGFRGQDAFFGFVLPMGEALLAQPDIAISRNGAFQSALGLQALTAQLVKRGRDLKTAATGQRPGFLDSQQDLYSAFSPENLWWQSEENYNLQTGAWIGATLEQGTWYQITSSLRLAGLTDWFLPHDIEFAYTRDVPCTPPAAAPQCVEIVIHATPQGEALDDMMKQSSSFTRVQRYWSATYIRLVTEPGTLTPYSFDMRRYWHITGRESSPGPASGMERVVTSFTYSAPGAGASGPS